MTLSVLGVGSLAPVHSESKVTEECYLEGEATYAQEQP